MATAKKKPKPKGRAAGDGSHYRVAVVDAQGNVRGSGVQLPSVTTILKALPKDGLPYWGFKLGTHAAHHLVNDSPHDLGLMDADEVYEAAKKTEFAPYRQLTRAGKRGTDVHDIAETLIAFGSIDIDALPEDKQGYARAMEAYYTDQRIADAPVVMAETCLFSMEHRFAGTADLIRQVSENHWRLEDWKTSKGIYESHLLQLAAYRHAAVEMGLVPRDAMFDAAVVRLGADGKYEQRFCLYSVDDFLAVKRVWELLYG